MKKKKLALWLVLALAQPSAFGFYCGHFLITEGDYKVQVFEKCGNPDFYESRVEYRATVLRGWGISQPGVDIVQQEPVRIDEWTYDFGPRRFMQWLYFENSRLLQIKTLGYGTINLMVRPF